MNPHTNKQATNKQASNKQATNKQVTNKQATNKQATNKQIIIRYIQENKKNKLFRTTTTTPTTTTRTIYLSKVFYMNCPITNYHARIWFFLFCLLVTLETPL